MDNNITSTITTISETRAYNLSPWADLINDDNDDNNGNENISDNNNGADNEDNNYYYKVI